MILNMNKSSITPSHHQQAQLLKRVVVLKDSNQLKQITSDLRKRYKYIKEKCAPTKEQLELCKGALAIDFGKDAS